MYGVHQKSIYDVHQKNIYGVHQKCIYGVHQKWIYGVHQPSELAVASQYTRDLWTERSLRQATSSSVHKYFYTLGDGRSTEWTCTLMYWIVYLGKIEGVELEGLGLGESHHLPKEQIL